MMDSTNAREYMDRRRPSPSEVARMAGYQQLTRYSQELAIRLRIANGLQETVNSRYVGGAGSADGLYVTAAGGILRAQRLGNLGVGANLSVGVPQSGGVTRYAQR